MYHSYEILTFKRTEDFNGDKAFQFKIILGGEDLKEVQEALEVLLEQGLNKELKI